MQEIDPDDGLLVATQFLALNIIADDRWEVEADDFGISVFGMILYGYTLKYSRILGFDPNRTIPVVHFVLTEHAKCSASLADSILSEAEKSAFNPDHHRGQYNLIAVGSGYTFSENMSAEVDNTYANIAAYRTTGN